MGTMDETGARREALKDEILRRLVTGVAVWMERGSLTKI